MMQCVTCSKSSLSPQKQGKGTFCKCFWNWDTNSFLYETKCKMTQQSTKTLFHSIQNKFQPP
jgi:hypothetical protein